MHFGGETYQEPEEVVAHQEPVSDDFIIEPVIPEETPKRLRKAKTDVVVEEEYVLRNSTHLKKLKKSGNVKNRNKNAVS